jgi:hypothetical protein
MKFRHFFRSESGRVYGSDNPRNWSDCVKLTRAEGQRAYRAQACADLRELIKPGDTVYTILRHVSSSGMSRRISVLITQVEERTDANGKRKRVPIIRDISGYVSTAIDYPQHDGTGALVVGGCGMDMGFHVVYSLGRTLWPEGTKRPHRTRNGEPDRDGGYALRHSWV